MTFYLLPQCLSLWAQIISTDGSSLANYFWFMFTKCVTDNLDTSFWESSTGKFFRKNRCLIHKAPIPLSFRKMTAQLRQRQRFYIFLHLVSVTARGSVAGDTECVCGLKTCLHCWLTIEPWEKLVSFSELRFPCLWIHVLAIVNRAAMNIGVHMSLSILVSLVCMPSSGIAGSYGSSISSF